MAGVIASQTTLEALDAGSGVKGVRASQAVAEVVHNDAVPLIRASQAVAEVLHNDAIYHVRVSQVTLEVLHDLGGASGYVSIVGTAK